jgi:hypothetical protein
VAVTEWRPPYPLPVSASRLIHHRQSSSSRGTLFDRLTSCHNSGCLHGQSAGLAHLALLQLNVRHHFRLVTRVLVMVLGMLMMLTMHTLACSSCQQSSSSTHSEGLTKAECSDEKMKLAKYRLDCNGFPYHPHPLIL